jgi:hypothetical protein
MQEFFPTDVRIKVEGDAPLDAEALIGPTRRLLFAGLALQKHYGDARPVCLQQTVGPASFVKVFLHGGQKIITVSTFANPEQRQAPVVPEDQVPIDPAILPGKIFMLHGWVRDGTLVTVGPKQLLDSYAPTGASLAWGLPGGYHTNEQLGDGSVRAELMGAYASRQTGRMKAVVQAIYGIGIADDPQNDYLTNTPPSPTKRAIYPFGMTYSNWTESVGLYKAGAKNHWLVKIGTDGVYAMPLLTFDATKGASYRAAVIGRGDYATGAILDEFGGIPTGEGFPSGAALTTAIAAGKVLQLLTAGDVGGFFNYFPISLQWGWAFNDDGDDARNTVAVWRSEYQDPTDWDPDDGLVPPYENFNLWAQHWQISITLNEHDVRKPYLATPESVGSGSAELVMVEEGLIPENWWSRMYVPNGSGELERPYALEYSPSYAGVEEPEGFVSDAPSDYDNGRFNGASAQFSDTDGRLGATVFVYWAGNRLERVKWCPGHIESDNGNGQVVFSPPAFVSGLYDPRESCKSSATLLFAGDAFRGYGGWGTHSHPGPYVTGPPPDLEPYVAQAIGDVNMSSTFVQPYGTREAWICTKSRTELLAAHVQWYHGEYNEYASTDDAGYLCGPFGSFLPGPSPSGIQYGYVVGDDDLWGEAIWIDAMGIRYEFTGIFGERVVSLWTDGYTDDSSDGFGHPSPFDYHDFQWGPDGVHSFINPLEYPTHWDARMNAGPGFGLVVSSKPVVATWPQGKTGWIAEGVPPGSENRGPDFLAWIGSV